MWKIIKYIIDLKDQLHKLEERCKVLFEQRNKWEEQYNNLYYGVQSLLAQNNEMLVLHYDGTDLPTYTIEECTNYKLNGDSNDK